MFNQKEYNKKYRLENPEKIKQIQEEFINQCKKIASNHL